MNADADLSDFIARPVSSMPAPSLGYLILSSWYSNPMQQPRILSNASSWLDAVGNRFRDGNRGGDRAAQPGVTLRQHGRCPHVRRMSPHASIAASTNVPASVQTEISEALLRLHEDPDHFTALHELDIERFVPAQVSEFQELDNWLNGIFTFN